MQAFETCITEISICFHSGWHLALLCDASDLTMNKKFSRELVHCYVTHVMEITSVCPLRTKLIHINPSYWTSYHLFEIILEWELPIDWNSNPMFYLCKTIASKTFTLIWIILFKILNCIGVSRLKLSEPSPDNAYNEQYFLIQVTCNILMPKAKHGTKIYEQWQDPMKKSQVKQL